MLTTLCVAAVLTGCPPYGPQAQWGWDGRVRNYTGWGYRDLYGNGSLGAKMIDGMKIVTQGLATAFDTTFLGLIAAILLLFPTETLKRIEYAMLDRIETFTNESLLRRMADDSGDGALSPDAARLLEPVFRKHQQWLLEWQNQVAELGVVIGRDFEKHTAAVRTEMEHRDNGKLQELLQVAGSLSDVASQASEVVRQFQEASVAVALDFKATINGVAALQSELAANTAHMGQLAEAWKAVPASLPRASDDGRLEQTLTSLDRTLGHLFELAAASDQSVPLAPQRNGDSPPGRGLFGMFKRRAPRF